jgi:hypothetical protein
MVEVFDISVTCHAHKIAMKNQSLDQSLIIPPNTLVFYIDESGDETLNNPEHPIFAFGGVACTTESYISLARTWQTMKAATFPQVTGPLHANTHLRRLSDTKRLAVLSAISPRELARFGTIMTANTIVPVDQIVMIACQTLAKRLANIAEGMVALNLWTPPGPVYAVFEHSARLSRHLENQFTGLALKVGTHTIPIEGCFMPKSVANPFLEIADFVAYTLGNNVKYQLEHGCAKCTDSFQSLFRDVSPPLSNYIEVVKVV